MHHADVRHNNKIINSRGLQENHRYARKSKAEMPGGADKKYRFSLP